MSIAGDKFVLIAVEFETFGAGLPESLEPGQTLIHLEAGGMRIDGFAREISDLRYLIGHMTQHILYIADESIPLDTLDQAGQSVRFILRELNLWKRLYFRGT